MPTERILKAWTLWPLEDAEPTLTVGSSAQPLALSVSRKRFDRILKACTLLLLENKERTLAVVRSAQSVSALAL